MKKILVSLILILTFFMPNIANALTDEYSFLSIEEKYYKTIIFDSSVNLSLSNNQMYKTIEITKEEYEKNIDNAILPLNNTVQTEYKKMTIKILTNGSKYKYEAVLEWKNMPKVRSYDSLAIGFYQSVKATEFSYKTNYCLNNGNCYTQNNYYSKNMSTGVGVTFLLPSSTSINTLKHTLTVYVDKNVSDATIIEQKASADYAHAVKNINSSLAQNYTINTSGIHFQNGVSSYYDDINYASTTINCNW